MAGVIPAGSFVWLQPQVRLSTGSTVGFEALLRPVDMTRIVADPDLPVLTVEALASIGFVGKVSVNVELAHLTGFERVGAMAAIARQAGFELMVEVTERDGLPPVEVVAGLRAAGVLVAFDDVAVEDVPAAVGLRPDWLKLTGAALVDPAGLAVLAGLCRAAGVVSVVEEIESEVDRAVAVAAGVDVGQGFLWERSVRVSDGLAELRVS